MDQALAQEQIEVFEEVQTVLQNEIRSVKIQNSVGLDSGELFDKLYKKVLFSRSYNSLQILEIFHAKAKNFQGDIAQNFDKFWNSLKSNPFNKLTRL